MLFRRWVVPWTWWPASRRVYVITRHCTKAGDPKLVEACSYPLTGLGVVDRIYTDLAVIDITPHGFQLVELSHGVTFEYAQERTGASLIPIPNGDGGGAG